VTPSLWLALAWLLVLNAIAFWPVIARMRKVEQVALALFVVGLLIGAPVGAFILVAVCASRWRM
jgi:hypothetical protein